MKQKVQYFLSLLQKNQITIILLVIFLVGLYLRGQNLEMYRFSLWGYDEARDLLVARHIIEYAETISRGPAAFGGMGTLTNSAGYYYAIALLWYVSGSVVVFSYVWLVLISSEIILAYLVGKAFYSKRLGIIFSSIIALSPELINESKNLYQPYFLPLFMLLFLFFLLRRGNKIKDFFLAVFFLLIPLHLHYGILLSIPVSTLWLLYEMKFFYNDKKGKLKFFTILPFLVYFFLFFSWLLATYTNKPFDQLAFFKNIVQGVDIEAAPTNIGTIYLEVEKSIWRTNDYSLLILSMIIGAPAIILFLLDTSQSLLSKRRVCFLTALFSSVFMSYLLKAKVYEIYFLVLLPVHLLLISFAINFYYQKNKFLGLILISLTLATSFHLYNRERRWILNAQDNYMYDEIKKSSTVVSQYLRQKNLQDTFTLALIADDNTYYTDGWGTTPFWFFLEQIADEKLVHITNDRDHANITPDPKIVKDVMLICEHRSGITSDTESNCLDKFYADRSNLNKNPIKIYESNVFTIWDISIQDDGMIFQYKDYIPDRTYSPYNK
jgi:hypothetical protein